MKKDDAFKKPNSPLILRADWWEQRWKNGQIGWDIGYASPPITEYMSQYSNKNAAILIPGCGNAHEAEYMIDNGFQNITLLDISPTAVELAKKKFADYPQIKVICDDFFKHDGKYDLIIEQTFFCTLLPEGRYMYADKAHKLLNEGGKIIGVLFGVQFPHQGPPFGGVKNEYETIFEEKFTIHTMDECYNSIKPRAGRELFINLVRK